MTVALTLKFVPNILAYTMLCDAAGDISASRTRAELIADCETSHLPALKKVFEAASTNEAWTALASKYVPAVIPGNARPQLTAKFENVDGGHVLKIAGKSTGVSQASVEVRAK